MLVEKAPDTRRPRRAVKALGMSTAREYSFDVVVGHLSAMQAAKGCWPTRSGCSEGHRWPGNVRELRNTIERAMVLINR